MKKIPFCKHSPSMNIIAAYVSIPFETDHGDGGFAIRVIEIYRLFKMERLLAEFEMLTGYGAPWYRCDAEEINALVERGTAICDAARQASQEAEREKAQCESLLTNLSQGAFDAAKWRMSLKEALRQSQDKVLRAKDNAERARLMVNARQGLLGLLRPVVEDMLNKRIKVLRNKVMEQLPIIELPAYTYQVSLHPSGLEEKSHISAWKTMDALQSAIQKVVNHCRTPTNKYELNHHGVEKAELCRCYYSADGELFRQLMPVADYVDSMLPGKVAFSKKQRLMKSDI
ncbi:hypothetical protein [Dickeya oryzae]